MTGRQETVDGRPALRFERRLPHRRERVWRAVTEPQELARWFVVAEVPWTPVAGEEFEAGGDTGRITELDAPRKLAWEWGAERYSFELTADGDDATTLVFTHVFNPDARPRLAARRGLGDLLRAARRPPGRAATSPRRRRTQGIDALMARYRESFA